MKETALGDNLPLLTVASTAFELHSHVAGKRLQIPIRPSLPSSSASSRACDLSGSHPQLYTFAQPDPAAAGGGHLEQSYTISFQN